MRSLAITLCATLLLATAARAALPILGGDLLVLRDGNGTTDAAANTASSVFIDDFRNTAGAWSLVQSLPAPATGPNALTLNYTGNTEGGINLSTDGKYLTFAGYRQNAGTNPGIAPASQDPAAVPRVVGVLSLANGEIDTSTILRTDATAPANLFYKGAVRDVVSTDGNHFWVAGASAPGASIPTGLVYVPDLGSGVTSIVLNAQNLTGATILAGQLYTTSFGSLRKINGSSLPTAPPTTDTLVISGLPVAANNSLLLDLDPALPGPDTLYIGGSDNGILKYSLVAGAWTHVGTIATGNVFADRLTGFQSAAGVTLFYSSNGSPLINASSNQIGTLTDSAGYNAPFAASPANILAAPPNTSFHGLAIVPTPGDLTNDFVLNADDYALLDRFVARHGLGAPTASRLDGDLNDDGTVDAADFLLIDTAYAAANGSPSPTFLAQRESEFGAQYVSQLIATLPEPALPLFSILYPLSSFFRRRRPQAHKRLRPDDQ